MKQPRLCFIGITPPETISAPISQLKQEISTRFGTTHALKSPPHITLQPPFEWPSEDDNTLCRTLENFASQQKPFSLTLDDFGFFGKRVVFIKIAEHQPVLTLHHHFLQSVADKLPIKAPGNAREIHPHITLATRDLDDESFALIRHYIAGKTCRAQIIVDSVVLFRHHDKKWERSAEFFFRTSTYGHPNSLPLSDNCH